MKMLNLTEQEIKTDLHEVTSFSEINRELFAQINNITDRTQPKIMHSVGSELRFDLMKFLEYDAFIMPTKSAIFIANMTYEAHRKLLLPRFTFKLNDYLYTFITQGQPIKL